MAGAQLDVVPWEAGEGPQADDRVAGLLLKVGLITPLLGSWPVASVALGQQGSALTHEVVKEHLCLEGFLADLEDLVLLELGLD